MQVKLALSSFHSAEVNPAPLPLHLRSVPYARTPTGQGVDFLVPGGAIVMPTRELYQLKQVSPLIATTILPPGTAPLSDWNYLLVRRGFAPAPLTSLGTVRLQHPLYCQ